MDGSSSLPVSQGSLTLYALLRLYARCRYMTSTIAHDTPDAFPFWGDAKNLRQCDVDELRTGDTKTRKTGVLAPLMAGLAAGAR